MYPHLIPAYLFVKYKFDLTQRGSSQNLAFVVDLETLELIWIDFPYSYLQSYAIAADVNSNLNIVSTIKKALQTHMTMYDLVRLHRGHIKFCEDKENAKKVAKYVADLKAKTDDIDTKNIAGDNDTNVNSASGI